MNREQHNFAITTATRGGKRSKPKLCQLIRDTKEEAIRYLARFARDGKGYEFQYVGSEPAPLPKCHLSTPKRSHKKQNA